MAQINPHINFNGNAEEAFTFYKSIFGGEFANIIRFKDLSSPEFPVAENEANKIMHIALPIGKNILMANDVPEIMGKTNENENRSKISISAESKEEADKLFNGLSAGGQIEMPIADSPWGSYFGMFRDKYGIEWMVDFDPNYKGQIQLKKNNERLTAVWQKWRFRPNRKPSGQERNQTQILYDILEHRNLKTFPTFTTERLTLRQLLDNDVQEIFLLRSDTLINKYLDRQPSKTLEDALEFIEKIKSNSLSYWAIAQKGNEKLVGTICLFDVSEELKKCEIGYELLTEYQGKGIMREAAKKIIEYSIQTLGLKTIDAYTHKDNQSSTNLLKELKFMSTDTVGEKSSNLILFRLNISSKINKD